MQRRSTLRCLEIMDQVEDEDEDEGQDEDENEGQDEKLWNSGIEEPK